MSGVSAASTAAPLSYYLPGDEYRKEIPRPSSYLGYEVGEWHLRHDQLVGYLQELARLSDRVHFEEIGRTYEARPLVMLTITSPGNHGRLEQIRRQHLALCDPTRQVADPTAQPLVIHMGYGVHGNESSASNASILVAYHLAASTSEEVRKLLDQSVILLDPCLNPDGFSRFAQWANSHRGKHPIASAASREHNEAWPGGRTNHYWFDLNRDWLLAQHPESQARLRKFHQWRPNVHTDFHEMSSDSTYFFQPGVKARKHPLTPEKNVTLTERFALYHAAFLDEDGTLYYNEERFDDFYYGKGSTYPDAHGGVGILFEQASSRGHLRESVHGQFDFAFTIRNQVRTSLSTLTGSLDLRGDLLNYQREFYTTALTEADRDPVKAYLFGSSHDPASNHAMLELLLRHQIEVRELTRDETTFAQGSAWIALAKQPQYRLLKSLFERRTEFEDNVFYDVSTWTLPLAMNIPCVELTEIPEDLVGGPLRTARFPIAPRPPKSEVAYAFEWHGQFAPRALHRLHAAGLRMKVTPGTVTAPSPDGVAKLDRGTVFIPLGIQEPEAKRHLPRILREITTRDGITVHAITSGLTPEGGDLGSPSFSVLQMPRPLLVVGSGVDGYEAGEVWHLLDERHDIEVTLVEHGKLGTTDLSRFTHLLMVDGKYSLSDKRIEEIKRWIDGGGILVATKGAAKWASDHEIGNARFRKGKGDHAATDEDVAEILAQTPARRLPYGQHEQDRDSRLTKGTIFETDLDVTHPLGWGYPFKELPIFRDSNLVLEPSRDPYATVALYTAKPLLAGYVHPENLAQIQGSAALTAERVGKGCVISFADNPNFRAFWTGTSKLYLNALFFGSVIAKTDPEDTTADSHDDRH